MRVLSVTSELFPLIKTGGLADVTGALPSALAVHGVEMRSLLPAYPEVMAALTHVHPLVEFGDLFGGTARLLSASSAAGALYTIEATHLFDRPGGPYQNEEGVDWPDNAIRFAALARAALALAQQADPSWHPEILHCHDWQAGLTPAYLALSDERQRSASVMTVHNLAFQGQFPAALLPHLGLPSSSYAVDGLEYYGALGFLKAGLYYADALSTVSPTYAREIQTPAGGMGLGGLLATRAADLAGILNGIDEIVWNPAADSHLPATYNADDLAGKATVRAAMQSQLGLTVDEKVFIVGVISRLSHQKGLDLLLAVLPSLLAEGVQLAMLGSGNPALQDGYKALMAAHPGQIGVRFGYDETISHHIQAGVDSMLVPSRFEPCGLTQLIALRYGSPPIVTRVGGLADSIIDANEAALRAGVATGFCMAPDDPVALTASIRKAAAIRRGDPTLWRRIQRAAMSQEMGWPASAGHYRELYARALANRARLQ